MFENVEGFFTALAERRYEPLLHSVTGTVQWDVKDEGKWSVVINKGTLTVNRDAKTADSALSCSKDTFLALMKGEQNPLTAFLQGKLAIEGNIGLAQVFQRVFESQASKEKATSSRREA